MKVAALAALGVLVAFSAGAAQQQRQLVSPATTCDNDGHCKTASADAAPAVHRIRPRAQKTIATAVQPLPQPRPSQTDSQAQQDQASEQQLQDTQQAQPQAEQTQDPQQAKPQQQSESRRNKYSRRSNRSRSGKPHVLDANGNKGIVISHKTGARARVGVAYAARFQAYIDDLENNHGARVLFMNGIRPGRCSPASEHPCGKAWTCASVGAAWSIRAAICRRGSPLVVLPPCTAFSRVDAGAIRTTVTRRSGLPLPRAGIVSVLCSAKTAFPRCLARLCPPQAQ